MMQNSNPFDLKEVEECAMLLQQTFKNNNPLERRAAEEALVKLSEDRDRFFEILLALITLNQSNELLNQAKDAALAFLNNMIKSPYFRMDLKPDQRFQKAHLILQAMAQENLKLAYRGHLGFCLTTLLSIENSEEIKRDILPLISQALKLQNKGLIGGLIALRALTNTTSQTLKLTTLFRESIDFLIELGNTIVDAVLNQLSVFNSQDMSQLQNESTGEKLTTLLESLQAWIMTIRNFIMKLEEKKGLLLESVTNKDNILLIFTKILCISLNTNFQMKDCFISTSGFEQFDNMMNEIKTLVMKSMNAVVEFIFQFKRNLPVQNSKFYILLPTILPLIIATLSKFCRSDKINFDDWTCNPSCANFLIELLQLLSVVGKHTEFHFILAEHKKTILVDIVYSLIRTGKLELKLMNDNPGDFVQLAIDTCDNQQSMTLKTQAAKLLETMCDYIDGSLTFIAILALTVIDFSLSSSKIEEIPSKFPTLSAYQESIIIAKTNANIRVETSLLILATLSYILPQREDLLKLFEKLLTTYKEFFLKSTDPLICSRYCLVISYYASKIFADKKWLKVYAAQITFLVGCAGLREEQYRIVAYQACDGLKTIFEDPNMVSRVSSFINEIMQKFVEYISYVKIPEFFDILQSIAKSYAKYIVKNPEVLIMLVKILSQQIQVEVNSQQNTSAQGNIVFSKCWNILRTIGDRKKYKEYYKAIEEVLVPLYECMSTPEKISFDDEILLLITSFIRNSGTVTDIQWRLVQTFPKIFEKNQLMFNNLFSVMNLMIVHGRGVLANEYKVIELFIEMSIKAIFCTAKKSNEANQAEGAVMLQLLIQNLGDKLTLESWQSIIIAVLDRLSKEIKKNFLKARLLGVILHGFIVNYAVIEELILQKNILGQIIDVFITNMKLFIHAYDKKTYVMGVSSIFVQPKIHPSVKEKIPALFACTVTMLKIIQTIEQAEALRKKRDKKKDGQYIDLEEIPSNEKIIDGLLQDFQSTDEAMQNMKNKMDGDDRLFDEGEEDMDANGNNNDEGEMKEDDEEDKEDDDLHMHENEEMEAQATMEQLVTDFKTKDEFAFFKNVVIMMKDMDHNGLAQIIQTMPQAKQNYLRQVLQSQRVVLDAVRNKTEARRIVTVRGKKIQKP